MARILAIWKKQKQAERISNIEEDQATILNVSET
jgi:hypothetical protein